MSFWDRARTWTYPGTRSRRFVQAQPAEPEAAIQALDAIGERYPVATRIHEQGANR